MLDLSTCLVCISIHVSYAMQMVHVCSAYMPMQLNHVGVSTLFMVWIGSYLCDEMPLMPY